MSILEQPPPEAPIDSILGKRPNPEPQEVAAPQVAPDVVSVSSPMMGFNQPPQPQVQGQGQMPVQFFQMMQEVNGQQTVVPMMMNPFNQMVPVFPQPGVLMVDQQQPQPGVQQQGQQLATIPTERALAVSAPSSTRRTMKPWLKYGERTWSGTKTTYLKCRYKNCGARRKVNRNMATEEITEENVGEHSNHEDVITDTATAAPRAPKQQQTLALTQGGQNPGMVYHYANAAHSRRTVKPWLKYGERSVANVTTTYFKCRHKGCGARKKVQARQAPPTGEPLKEGEALPLVYDEELIGTHEGHPPEGEVQMSIEGAPGLQVDPAIAGQDGQVVTLPTSLPALTAVASVATQEAMAQQAQPQMQMTNEQMVADALAAQQQVHHMTQEQQVQQMTQEQMMQQVQQEMPMAPMVDQMQQQQMTQEQMMQQHAHQQQQELAQQAAMAAAIQQQQEQQQMQEQMQEQHQQMDPQQQMQAMQQQQAHEAALQQQHAAQQQAHEVAMQQHQAHEAAAAMQAQQQEMEVLQAQQQQEAMLQQQQQVEAMQAQQQQEALHHQQQQQVEAMQAHEAALQQMQQQQQEQEQQMQQQQQQQQQMVQEQQMAQEQGQPQMQQQQQQEPVTEAAQ